MRSRRWALSLLLVAALVTSGCLSWLDEVGGGSDDGQEQAGTVSFYLTQTMSLTRAPPVEEEGRSVPVGGFYDAWQAGDEQPTWQGPGLPGGMVVTEATLVFYYTTDAAVFTTGPQDQGFPEFVVYLGTEAAPMGWASVQSQDVVQEGEVVEVQASLELPVGGLVLPAGSQPVVKIAPVQAQQDEGGRMQILVNGTATPSRADLVVQPFTAPGHFQALSLDERATLAGSAYAAGQTEGVTSVTFELDVPTGAVGLVASLERVTGAGIADVDLEARGPDGEVVARSVTPEDDEGLALYGPNLEAVGPGTWQLRVTNYGNVATEVHLEAWLLQPAR